MTASGLRHRLTGRVAVALPPDEAYRLFTPLGEQAWAHGWSPRFPVPTADDTVLTAITEPGERHLAEFAGRYPDFLRSWETAIVDSLTKDAI